MAATVITNKVLDFNTADDLPTTSAVTAGDGANVTADTNDELMLVMLENSSATTTLTAVVKAGGGIQASGNLEITMAPSSKKGIVLESGKYKSSAGKINIQDKNTHNTVLKVAAVVLP